MPNDLLLSFRMRVRNLGEGWRNGCRDLWLQLPPPRSRRFCSGSQRFFLAYPSYLSCVIQSESEESGWRDAVFTKTGQVKRTL